MVLARGGFRLKGRARRTKHPLPRRICKGVRSFAPAPIAAELHTLARKGRPKTSEVDEAWRRALKKLK